MEEQEVLSLQLLAGATWSRGRSASTLNHRERVQNYVDKLRK